MSVGFDDVGEMLGLVVVGDVVGLFVGDTDGIPVGTLLGYDVGATVGDVVGSCVGVQEGSFVGYFVGELVGSFVGDNEGTFEGVEIVGDIDGGDVQKQLKGQLSATSCRKQITSLGIVLVASKMAVQEVSST